MVYDPTVGRFLSKDPLGLVVDPNPYRYVHNSPTNFTDPTGLKEWNWGVSAGAAQGTLRFEAFEAPYQARIKARDARGNILFLRTSSATPGAINVPAGSTVLSFGVFSGLMVKPVFSLTNPNADTNKRFYFIQFTKNSSQTNGVPRIDRPWGYDGAVDGDDEHPKKYGTQAITYKFSAMTDSPGNYVEIPASNFTRVGSKFTFNATGVEGALQAAEDYQHFVQNKVIQTSEFQTYLVDCHTFKPVGYLSWSYTTDYSDGKLVIHSPVSSNAYINNQSQNPSWHLGSDPTVWKPLK